MHDATYSKKFDGMKIANQVYARLDGSEFTEVFVKSPPKFNEFLYKWFKLDRELRDLSKTDYGIDEIFGSLGKSCRTYLKFQMTRVMPMSDYGYEWTKTSMDDLLDILKEIEFSFPRLLAPCEDVILSFLECIETPQNIFKDALLERITEYSNNEFVGLVCFDKYAKNTSIQSLGNLDLDFKTSAELYESLSLGTFYDRLIFVGSPYHFIKRHPANSHYFYTPYAPVTEMVHLDFDRITWKPEPAFDSQIDFHNRSWVIRWSNRTKLNLSVSSEPEDVVDDLLMTELDSQDTFVEEFELDDYWESHQLEKRKIERSIEFTDSSEEVKHVQVDGNKYVLIPIVRDLHVLIQDSYQKLKVDDLEPGMSIILVTREDVRIQEIADQRLGPKALILRESLYDWKTNLRDRYDKDQHNTVADLQESGSGIFSDVNVQRWARWSREQINAPRKHEDFEVIMRYINMDDHFKEYWGFIQQLREEHQRAGRFISAKIRDYVERYVIESAAGSSSDELLEDDIHITKHEIESISEGSFKAPVRDTMKALKVGANGNNDTQ